MVYHFLYPYLNKQVKCPKKGSTPQKIVSHKCAKWNKYAAACENKWMPICDSDGVTSANTCEFERRKCAIYFGEGRKVKMASKEEC